MKKILYYVEKAAHVEKSFFRRKICWFFTGTGKKNRIVAFSKNHVEIQTEEGNAPFRIQRLKLREALAYVFQKRTAIRKDLECFSKFSSALLALIRIIIGGICKIYKTNRGLLRLSLKDTRFYFSGVSRSPGDLELIQEQGGRWVLMSYHDLRYDQSCHFRDYLKRYEQNLILDSGAFSVYKAKLKGKSIEPIQIEDYISFIENHRDVIHQFFNLDVIDSPEQTKRNQQILEERLGEVPIPVWHCGSDFADLEHLVAADKYAVIGIGGTAFIGEQEKETLCRKIFEFFPLVNFHLLGCASNILWRWPFFSADATSYLNRRKNGPKNALITPFGQVDAPERWSVDECISYSIQTLASLEETYDKQKNFQLDFLVPPKVKRPIQLSFSF
jgi:hypothetical protein